MNVLLRGLFLSCLLLLHAFPAARVAEECFHRDGASYRGTCKFAANGDLCLNWLEVQKSSTSPSSFAAADHNYCRNPDGASGPWCYVTGKDGTPESRLCDIPPCHVLDPPSPTASLGVSQDVNSDKKTVIKPADLVPSQMLDTHSSTASPGESQVVEGDKNQVFESADLLPSRSESAAVQPVIGISQRVRVKPKEKKDLGTLGYVLGVVMMVIIIAIGSGIVVGYIYKRGRDLKKQHEQTVYEREMQRITLPLSAFTNPSCEIVDENTIVVHASQTPVEEGLQEGDAPLMGQAGTPGA